MITLGNPEIYVWGLPLFKPSPATGHVSMRDHLLTGQMYTDRKRRWGRPSCTFQSLCLSFLSTSAHQLFLSPSQLTLILHCLTVKYSSLLQYLRQKHQPIRGSVYPLQSKVLFTKCALSKHINMVATMSDDTKRWEDFIEWVKDSSRNLRILPN